MNSRDIIYHDIKTIQNEETSDILYDDILSNETETKDDIYSTVAEATKQKESAQTKPHKDVYTSSSSITSDCAYSLIRYSCKVSKSVQRWIKKSTSPRENRNLWILE